MKIEIKETKCEFCGIVLQRPPHYSHRQWSVRRFCSRVCKGIKLKPLGLVHNKSHTAYTKRMLSLVRAGSPSPNKGKHLTAITKAKLRVRFAGINSMLWIDGRSSNIEYQRFRNRQKANRRRHASDSHTQTEWINLKALHDNACASCGNREPDIKLTEDHIVPISCGGSNAIQNIQPLCSRCNSQKGVRTIRYKEVG